jgi:hypothetical protein
MANVQKWSNVAVSMQSALASAVTITGITNANPGVVSWSTGTDPTNGQFVILQVVGMNNKLANKVVRVANVNGAGNTFELEGVDTTTFGSFSSGTFQVITFGTSIGILRDVSGTGGEPEELDATTMHDSIRQIEYGAATAQRFSGTALWDPSDAGFVALKAASDTGANRAFLFTFETGFKYTFYGRVFASGAPTGSAQAIVETPISMTVRGTGTAYSS